MTNGTISIWLANKIQDALLGGINFAPPGKHLGYALTASSANGFGAEPVGANYGRVQAPPSLWSVASDGTATNLADIECPRASGPQGNPTSLVIYDSSVGGNPLVWLPIDGALTVQTRNSLIIPAGALTHRFKATSHYSQFWRVAIMNFLYLGIQLPIEPILWAGYTTSAPTATASGTEPTATEYDRQALNNNKTTFTQAVNGNVGTAINTQYPESASNQGNVTHVALFGSETGSPYLCSAPLTPPVAMTTNSQMILRAGSFNFQLR